MKWFAETTDWKDRTPNGIYLLNDSKTKMYAYRSPRDTTIKIFKNPIRIDLRGRKFAINSVQFKTQLQEEEPEGRVTQVHGSKGDVYQVTELNGNWACTCSGFKFRGDCKHVKSVRG
jgi:hypothetical protein